ncbi:hypothetical protein HIM_00338 [Hirsutella minnesotensis 3608]|nr:hypothetical protein HIM_00338 [Hirsutella minnesotensis 3608]
MAVVSKIRGLTVTIKIDGRPAKEHGTTESEVQESGIASTREAIPSNSKTAVPTINCYIESITGARFSILVEAASEFKRQHAGFLVAHCYIDGIFVRGQAKNLGELPPKHRSTFEVTNGWAKGSNSGNVIAQHFTFAPVLRGWREIPSATNDALRREGIPPRLSIPSRLSGRRQIPPIDEDILNMGVDELHARLMELRCSLGARQSFYGPDHGPPVVDTRSTLVKRARDADDAEITIREARRIKLENSDGIVNLTED